MLDLRVTCRLCQKSPQSVECKARWPGKQLLLDEALLKDTTSRPPSHVPHEAYVRDVMKKVAVERRCVRVCILE